MFSSRFMHVYAIYLLATWGNINVKQQVSKKMLMQWLTHLAGKTGGNMWAIWSKWCLSSCFRWRVGSECRVSGSRAPWSRREEKVWRVKACPQLQRGERQSHTDSQPRVGGTVHCKEEKKKILLPPNLIKQGKSSVFTKSFTLAIIIIIKNMDQLFI